MKTIKIFTDGACSGNPGTGGWGAVMLDGKITEKYNGSESNTTNNRMELRAAIEGILKAPNNSLIVLYTDSKYVKEGITTWIKNWKHNNWLTSNKKPVKNQDLWKQLDILNQEKNILWEWVKGHQDNNDDKYLYNNMADELAREAIE
jgi:ribonuclease HI